MTFFDRFAKLQSDVYTKGNYFQVRVFDDEVSLEDPVMWMDVSTDEARNVIYDSDNLSVDMMAILSKKYKTALNVEIVNVNDSIYFELPANRQNVVANSLFKKFIKYYKENYDGQLVVAEFTNYDLQEKFKAACERGIFPKDSLLLIEETTQEDYEDEYNNYNIKNRENNYNIFKEIVSQLEGKGLNIYSENSFVYIKNNSTQEIFNAFLNIQEVQDNDAFDDILSDIDDWIGCTLTQNGDYIFNMPFSGFRDESKNIIFETDEQNVQLLDDGQNEWMTEYIKQNEETFRNMFNANTIYSMKTGQTTLDEFFSESKTANKKSRLKRNS